MFSHISLVSICVYNIICITANTNLHAVVWVPHAGFNWIYILHLYVCVCVLPYESVSSICKTSMGLAFKSSGSWLRWPLGVVLGRHGSPVATLGALFSVTWGCQVRAAKCSSRHRPQITSRHHTTRIPGRMVPLVTTMLVLFGLPGVTHQGRL